MICFLQDVTLSYVIDAKSIAYKYYSFNIFNYSYISFL